MKQSASEIYSETFSDIRSFPILLLPLFLANVIYFGLTMLVGASLFSNEVLSNMTSEGLSASQTMTGAVLFLTLTGGLVQFVGYCLVQCMAVEVISEGGTSLGSSIRLLGQRLVPFLGAAIVVGVILFLAFAGGLVIAANFGLGGVIGYLIFIFVTTLFVSLTLPAVVYSDLGPLEAVAESFNKVKENFMRVFGFALLTFVLAIGVGILSGIVNAILGLAGSLIALFIAFWFSTVVPVALTRLYADFAAEEKQRREAWLAQIASQTVSRSPLDQF